MIQPYKSTFNSTIMKNYFTHNMILLSLCFCSLGLSTCSKDDEISNKPEVTWDIETQGIPKYVNTNYIEIDKIYEISKFRSGYGHNYSDAFEQCRSMKHYFEPKSNVDWSTIKIVSPISGTITRLDEEWAGTKLEIMSDEHPAFRFQIFHIYNSFNVKLNDHVVAGQQLGTHIGSQTMSDISVIVNDPTQQGKLISYFDVISDSVFNEYKKRGVQNRDDLIISKETRDANPLSCNGDMFTSADVLSNWVILNQ